MNRDSNTLNDLDYLVLCHLISNIKVEREQDYLFIISELIKDNTNLNVDALDLYLDVKESEEEFQTFLEEEILNKVKKDEDTITLNLEIDAEEGLKTLEKIKSAMDDIDARCESDNESNETIDPLLSAKKRLQDTISSAMDEEEVEHLYKAFSKSFPDLFLPERVFRYMYSNDLNWNPEEEIQKRINKLKEGDNK